MSGCSNVWNPKTLRSAAGAHLKVPIKSNVTWDVLHRVVPVDTQVFTFLNNNTHHKLLMLRIKKSEVVFLVSYERAVNDLDTRCKRAVKDLNFEIFKRQVVHRDWTCERASWDNNLRENLVPSSFTDQIIQSDDCNQVDL